MPGIRGERRFPRRVWLTGAIMAAFVISFGVYVYSEKQIDRANEQRYQSYKLADELRQSSDDLTRMVRTYVVTGDPAYKQAFLDILDIREGLRLRPETYGGIYWDFALLDPRFVRPAKGPGISLLDMMRQVGFTEDELRKLGEAKASSDDLTNREFEAMALMESAESEEGADRMRAIAMVHDETYHRAKMAIMDPINAFYDMVERRTLANVQRAEVVAVIMRLVFVAFTVAVVVFLWRTYAESRAILGGSVQDVHARITRIGEGDFSVSDTDVQDGSVVGGLARMAARLEATEADRLRAAAELKDRNDDLRRSNADLEQFAYVASHDLQTPLRNIVSYTQLLERRYKGQLDADADDFIGFVVDNTKKMTRLIRDLLEYSRASRQSEPLTLISADVAMAEVLAIFKPDVERAGVQVEVGPLPSVMAVQSHLVSLFQNLLGNAIKYRADDRPSRISVMAERVSPHQWRFIIADNGIGIEAQYHDKIFEIFQRLNPAAETEGTGIGLTLCRRIVHRFGGQIWVESEPGQGTRIVFILKGG
ncbi:two-component sensor histidine kinase [Paramagnetospirillum kuznetsovii]|uniref:histidine kinase n=1 Tax=Paramagnetospirillum kuznetsovii TaxID=2053833 RepID=A0A364P3H5_9PROT|nr:ATP-binding protein [Paramagnetospirillum kuznetsovii]RAU23851.1 two-component sensor histidine kinase [Paramagnetospirillum kuznetsovii]